MGSGTVDLIITGPVGKELMAPVHMGVVLGATNVELADVDLGMCNAYRLKTLTV